MRKFIGEFLGGKLEFGEDRSRLLKFINANEKMRFELVPLLPESRKQRKFFEGAVVPLLTFYQEKMDHNDPVHCRKMREWLKCEFNGEMVSANGKVYKIPKTTKGELNKGFLQECIDYIQENYAPPPEALSPEKYQYWKDAIFSFEGGADNYIDYLVELNILKRP